jgi:hypothetical protein
MNLNPATNKEELLELTRIWSNAYRVYTASDDRNEIAEAWETIGQCEKLFEQANCWLGEDGEFEVENA